MLHMGQGVRCLLTYTDCGKRRVRGGLPSSQGREMLGHFWGRRQPRRPPQMSHLRRMQKSHQLPELHTTMSAKKPHKFGRVDVKISATLILVPTEHPTKHLLPVGWPATSEPTDATSIGLSRAAVPGSPRSQSWILEHSVLPLTMNLPPGVR